ncbi:hypothetical protein [Apilactobacillus timberlakei]|uniref:hypothetical protein n=1 Tax=Apilactobacillus timberlakei TaxID=2008380 RepID=UPI00112A908C|nr:hypothetical protein [Apilactobacillus timberlakei]TPR16720.1 hypothetical protein DYZ95_07000 [Apilactobacillus timberlakei]TPR21582.1 hypothetical protein DY083_06050 [Apilactobacillus timberlakei]
MNLNGLGKKRPLILCNTIMHIIVKKDINTTTALSMLIAEFSKQHNNLQTYKVVEEKDDAIDIAFSPYALNKFLNLLKEFIINKRMYNNHDYYQNLSVKMRIDYNKIIKKGDEFVVSDEFELADFDNVVLNSMFSNITLFIAKLSFFKLKDDISNLDIDKEYKNSKEITNAIYKMFFGEYKQNENEEFPTQLVATIPNLREFEQQKIESSYIPAFESEKIKKQNDNKHHHDNVNRKIDETDRNYQEEVNEQLNKKVNHNESENNNQSDNDDDKKRSTGKDNHNEKKERHSLSDEMPFIPKEWLSNFDEIVPKYLFDVDQAGTEQYKSINDAIANGNFDAQQYLVSYNNNYRKNANNFIIKNVNEIKKNLKAEMINYINEFNSSVEEETQKVEKSLSDDTDINNQANNFLNDRFYNKRKPVLEKERENKKAEAKDIIIEEAKSKIRQRFKEIDEDYDNRIKNAENMIYSQSQNMYDEKIKTKNELIHANLKEKKGQLQNRLLSNLQSVYNTCVNEVDKTSYILYNEFFKELDQRQPDLITNISNLIIEQTKMNESTKAMKQIKKGNFSSKDNNESNDDINDNSKNENILNENNSEYSEQPKYISSELEGKRKGLETLKEFGNEI